MPVRMAAFGKYDNNFVEGWIPNDLFRLAGCLGCHTDVDNDGPQLAGGRRFETPVGVFVSPNITPDKETGIGKWSDQNFLDALLKGKRPDGAIYYPAFPYTAYANMNYMINRFASIA